MARKQSLIALLLLLFGLTAPTWANPSHPTTLSAPQWNQLSPQQKNTLAPLSKDWDTMDVPRRLKWIGIAQRYPTLKPEAQKRLQERMQAWSKLTAEQRQKARKRYKKIQTLSPAERQELQKKWQKYNALSPEEKAQLRQNQASAQRKTLSPRAHPPAVLLKKSGKFPTETKTVLEEPHFQEPQAAPLVPIAPSAPSTSIAPPTAPAPAALPVAPSSSSPTLSTEQPMPAVPAAPNP